MAYRYQGSSNLELTDALESALPISSSLKKALLSIPRGEFLPTEATEEAYWDRPIRLENLGFNVSYPKTTIVTLIFLNLQIAPHMHAFCLQALNIQPGMSFLDVGSGCGLVTALAGFLVGPTGVAHGVDILEGAVDLSETSLQRMRNRGVPLSNVSFEKRNIFLQDRTNRKWDRIHVGATCPQKKKFQLYDLLNPGGALVVPINTHLILATKDIHGFTHETKLLEVRYGDLILPTKEESRQAEIFRESQISIPVSTFCNDFRILFNNKFLSDIKFLVEGKIIHAHKSILVGRSPYFFSFYNSGLRDTLEETIIVSEFSYSAFFEFLKYLYTDQCDFNDINVAGELIAISEFYRTEKLKAMAEFYLSYSIGIDNACGIFQLASQFHSTQLKFLSFEFILNNYEIIKKTKSFSKLEKEHFMEILEGVMKKLPQRA